MCQAKEKEGQCQRLIDAETRRNMDRVAWAVSVCAELVLCVFSLVGLPTLAFLSLNSSRAVGKRSFCPARILFLF